jgi:hypothetical protein
LKIYPAGKDSSGRAVLDIRLNYFDKNRAEEANNKTYYDSELIIIDIRKTGELSYIYLVDIVDSDPIDSISFKYNSYIKDDKYYFEVWTEDKYYTKNVMKSNKPIPKLKAIREFLIHIIKDCSLLANREIGSITNPENRAIELKRSINSLNRTKSALLLNNN